MNTYPVNFNLHYPTYQQVENFIGLSAWVSIALLLCILMMPVTVRSRKWTAKRKISAHTVISMILFPWMGLWIIAKGGSARWISDGSVAALMFAAPVFLLFVLSAIGLLG